MADLLAGALAATPNMSQPSSDMLAGQDSPARRREALQCMRSVALVCCGFHVVEIVLCSSGLAAMVVGRPEDSEPAGALLKRDDWGDGQLDPTAGRRGTAAQKEEVRPALARWPRDASTPAGGWLRTCGRRGRRGGRVMVLAGARPRCGRASERVLTAAKEVQRLDPEHGQQDDYHIAMSDGRDAGRPQVCPARPRGGCTGWCGEGKAGSVDADASASGPKRSPTTSSPSSRPRTRSHLSQPRSLEPCRVSTLRALICCPQQPLPAIRRRQIWSRHRRVRSRLSSNARKRVVRQARCEPAARQ